MSEDISLEDEGSDGGVDEELRRDISSLTAVLESQQTPVIPEASSCSEQRPLEGLQLCLESNQRLQSVLLHQLACVNGELTTMRHKLTSLTRHPPSRRGLTIWKFRMGGYFKDKDKKDCPTTSDITLPPGIPNYCTVDNKWHHKADQKLYAGVRMHAITLRSQPLMDILRSTSDKDAQRIIRKEISDLKDLPDAVLFNDLGDINWPDTAFEVFAGLRSVSDCRVHWTNVLSPLVNRSPWKRSEDKLLLSLAERRNGCNMVTVAMEMRTGRSAFSCLQRYTQLTSVATTLRRSYSWSEEEDARLLEAVAKFGEKNWKAVQYSVGNGRSHSQCLQRYVMSLSPGIRKGRWTDEEDKSLQEAVVLFGRRWAKVASLVPARTPMQCRERWCNVLDTSLYKGAWSAQEDHRLLALCSRYRGKPILWSRVAAELGHRTDSMCAKRWKHLSSRDAIAQQFANRILDKVAHLRHHHDDAMDMDDDWIPEAIQKEVSEYKQRLSSAHQQDSHGNREVATLMKSLTHKQVPTQLSARILKATIPNLISRINTELDGSIPIPIAYGMERVPMLTDMIPQQVLRSLLGGNQSEAGPWSLEDTQPGGSGLCVATETQPRQAKNFMEIPRARYIICQPISESAASQFPSASDIVSSTRKETESPSSHNGSSLHVATSADSITTQSSAASAVPPLHTTVLCAKAPSISKSTLWTPSVVAKTIAVSSISATLPRSSSTPVLPPPPTSCAAAIAPSHPRPSAIEAAAKQPNTLVSFPTRVDFVSVSTATPLKPVAVGTSRPLLPPAPSLSPAVSPLTPFLPASSSPTSFISASLVSSFAISHPEAVSPPTASSSDHHWDVLHEEINQDNEMLSSVLMERNLAPGMELESPPRIESSLPHDLESRPATSTGMGPSSSMELRPASSLKPSPAPCVTARVLSSSSSSTIPSEYRPRDVTSTSFVTTASPRVTHSVVPRPFQTATKDNDIGVSAQEPLEDTDYVLLVAEDAHPYSSDSELIITCHENPQHTKPPKRRQNRAGGKVKKTTTGKRENGGKRSKSAVTAAVTAKRAGGKRRREAVKLSQDAVAAPDGDEASSEKPKPSGGKKRRRRTDQKASCGGQGSKEVSSASTEQPTTKTRPAANRKRKRAQNSSHTPPAKRRRNVQRKVAKTLPTTSTNSAAATDQSAVVAPTSPSPPPLELDAIFRVRFGLRPLAGRKK